MSTWLLEPTYWNWMLLGVVLMAVEALLPGFFFLWMGVAALLVGLVLMVSPGLVSETVFTPAIIYPTSPALSCLAASRRRRKWPSSSTRYSAPLDIKTIVSPFFSVPFMMRTEMTVP